MPQVALIGYTNAGKSTLLNRVTEADVLAEDRLFSTLDSTVRRADLPDGQTVLLSDTVGFVRRLPHQLVEAFRSTLDDVKDADLLLHLVDASDPDPEGQIEAVHEVIEEVGADGVPELIVFNKIDRADRIELGRLSRLYPDSPMISALTGEGVDDLLSLLGDRMKADTVLLRLSIPYDRGDVLAAVHRVGEVLIEKHEDTATVIEARIPTIDERRFSEFVTA
jgi:GTP-binding protein HflX